MIEKKIIGKNEKIKRICYRVGFLLVIDLNMEEQMEEGGVRGRK